MSVQTRSPLRMGGACWSSGTVNDGSLPFIRGGALRATVWSGSLLTNAAIGGVPGGITSGGHVLITSGAGRLNSVIQHTQMISGLTVFFYDAATLPPSGVSVSGQNVLGIIPPTYTAGQVSGVSPVAFTGFPINIDMPFLSGLCAATPSGSPGFTVSWSPSIDPSIG